MLRRNLYFFHNNSQIAVNFREIALFYLKKTQTTEVSQWPDISQLPLSPFRNATNNTTEIELSNNTTES